MTIQWTGFPASVVADNTDILVGLDGGTTNGRFNASSFLFKANNLSDVASVTAAFANLSPLSAKGDLLWFDGTNNAALSVGSVDQILAVGGLNSIGWINNPGLLIANNLSDLASVPTALTNLGLSSADNVTFNSVVSTTSMDADTFLATTSSTSPSFISTGLDIASNANALTAHAGGGQGSALALTKSINRITIVASAGDSVVLPASLAGQSVVVINAAASNAMDCFPASGEVINALAADTALSIVANTTVMFFCAVNGIWNSIVTA